MSMCLIHIRFRASFRQTIAFSELPESPSLSAISQSRRRLFRKIQGNCARPSEIEGIGVVLDDDGQRFEHFAQMVPHGRLRGVGRSVGDSLNQYAVL